MTQFGSTRYKSLNTCICKYIINFIAINFNFTFIVATHSTQWEDPRLLADNKPAYVS